MAAIQTYTGQLGAQEKKIESLTGAISKGVGGLPAINEALRKALFEREKTLPGLEKDLEGKIQELYSADKGMAERYAKPGEEMYIEDPMARQALVSGQKADIRGEYGEILNLIQSRSQVLGNALEKGTELYKAGIAAQELELKQAESAWDRIFKKMEFGQRAGKEAKGEQAKTDYAEALKYILTQSGSREEAKEDIAAIAARKPEIAEDVYKLLDDLFPVKKEGELTLTEEYRNDLSAAVEAVISGEYTKDEALNLLYTKYPDKSYNLRVQLETALANRQR